MSRTMTTTVTRYNYDEETDEETEMDIEVTFLYDAGERPSWDSPGCPPDVDVVEAVWGGQHIELTDDEITELVGNVPQYIQDEKDAADEDRWDARRNGDYDDDRDYDYDPGW